MNVSLRQLRAFMLGAECASFSAAAARMLTGLFGDGFAFTDNTEMEFGLTARSFPSFNAAAAEAAISRMYGGIHYRPAIEYGLTEGTAMADLVWQRLRVK